MPCNSSSETAGSDYSGTGTAGGPHITTFSVPDRRCITYYVDMQLAYVGGAAQAAPAIAPAVRPTYKGTPEVESTGINLRPGSSDDGWVSPPTVTLSDGSEIQLFKDGEGLAAAYQAIGAAKRYIALEVYIFASDQTGRAFADLL